MKLKEKWVRLWQAVKRDPLSFAIFVTTSLCIVTTFSDSKALLAALVMWMSVVGMLCFIAVAASICGRRYTIARLKAEREFYLQLKAKEYLSMKRKQGGND